MSMTLRQLVACASPLIGSHTVREHMSATNCLTIGGDLTINGEMISLREEEVIILSGTKDDIIVLNLEPVIMVEEDEIIKIEEGIINGIC